VADDVQQGIALGGDPLAQRVQRGRADGPVGRCQHVGRDVTQGGSHAPDRCLRVEGGQPKAVTRVVRVGGQDEGAEVPPPDGREALVGHTGQVERERHPLVQSQEVPAAIEAAIQRGTQAFPAEGPEFAILDVEQDVQRVVAPGERLAEGDPQLLVSEKGLAQHGAVVPRRRLAGQLNQVQLEGSLMADGQEVS
jgi:hypothetical protein